MTVAAKRARVIETDWPEFGQGPYPPKPDLAEFESRLAATRERMDRDGLSHLLVFGDREHFFNLAWLTNLDPRFEEAALVLRIQGRPLLLVGNECEGYLPISPLFTAGKLRHERFQTFSLLNQARDASRRLEEILQEEGIGPGARVGAVGFKYFSETEHPDAAHALDIPSYVADTLRELAGLENVINAAGIFMNPDDGLRTFCSPAEIAYFEWTNALASEGVRKMLFGLREGMTDHEAGALSGMNGEPLGCHPTLSSGDLPGLSGPQGRILRRGDPMKMNICYWGANICRAGWIAESERDIPQAARDYVEAFAGPYFEVMSEWYARMRIGAPGGEFTSLVQENLPFEKFGIFLNEGHLIHMDEWVSSPMYSGSTIPIHSGMAIQVDVIPSNRIYSSTRLEDGIVIADETLRRELKARFPDCYERCRQRREFMAETLGVETGEEVLPLSNIPAMVPPWFLAPRNVLTLRPK